MAAACELTKLYEEVQRGTVAELRAHFHLHPPRGEFTLVIAGREPPLSPPRWRGGGPDLPPVDQGTQPHLSPVSRGGQRGGNPA
jgi:hypothetical protein